MKRILYSKVKPSSTRLRRHGLRHIIVILCMQNLASIHVVYHVAAEPQTLRARDNSHRSVEIESKRDEKAAASVFNLLSSIMHIKSFSGEHLQPKEQKQPPNRRLIYIPPPPITPFRGGLKTVHHEQNSTTVNHTTQSITAWTPKQFPDPWTNPLACGGAATAPFLETTTQNNNQTQRTEMNASKIYSTTDRDFMHWFDIPALGNDGQILPAQEQGGQFMQNKKLLFCDPDQLLDLDTLKTVVVKLQAFAETFASASLAEGGNFGENTIDLGSSEDGAVEPSTEGKVTGNKSFAGLIKSWLHLNGRGTNSSDGAQTRKLRGLRQLLIRKDISRDLGVWEEGSIKEPIEVGIALVKKIDLPAILRADSYFFYSDQDDMMNDAAQYFARYIHDTWYRHLMMQEQRISSPTNIVLIFISTSDKICYISSGTRIAAIMPWWRLEHVVQDMKPDLRKGKTGDALGIAIDELTELLQQGPPSFLDRLDDFVERFGVVIAFTLFTFVFATWGECRDRRKRFFSAERLSRMNAVEREKARRLQKEFQTKACPICLEPFESTNKQIDDDKPSPRHKKQNIKRVDSFGIPLIGSDDKPIKMLRCGHIFDSSCWKIWADSGQGNPWVCPVCRQDVGRVKRRRTNHSSPQQNIGAATTRREEDNRRIEVEERRASFVRVPPVTPSMLLLPVSHTHPSYSSIQSLASFGGTAFAPFSHPPLRRLYPRNPTVSNTQSTEPPSEETPLFEQTIATEESDDY